MRRWNIKSLTALLIILQSFNPIYILKITQIKKHFMMKTLKVVFKWNCLEQYTRRMKIRNGRISIQDNILIRNQSSKSSSWSLPSSSSAALSWFLCSSNCLEEKFFKPILMKHKKCINKNREIYFFKYSFD